MKNKLILVGAGGHCKSVIDSLDSANYAEIVIVGKSNELGHTINGYPVVGTDENLKELYDSGFNMAFITLGSIENTLRRRTIATLLTQVGFSFPNIIDKSALVSPSANMGHGIFVGKMAIINADSHIDNFAIINTHAVIEHDGKIGSFTHVSIGAVICGSCTVGSDVFVGANSAVRNNVTIGNRVLIGMSSCVIHDVRDDAVVMGNPAKEKKL
jgi:sugar O-acyltransferase (sialic acid O-acetyltransferase NeuD family)